MADFDEKRRKQLDTLLQQVLDLPEQEQQAFLKEVTTQDPGLYKDLKKLLQYARESDSFFGETLSDFLLPLLPLLEGDESPSEFTFEEGTIIGNYRIKKLIGKGGMGQVYLSERNDGAFKKEVALKCIKKGMDSEEILRRFRYERQVLARLQHPNIATLLDGGLTDEGQPYFAMEFVDGIPITDYCDQKKLAVRERLKLFTHVCEAVQYAHQQLVVHRDLKPSNILVTKNGTVKLLDFGIARILDDEHSLFTVPVTKAGLRLMTPEYAAPEQVKNEQISTATDIYTLGVLLLELLTGPVPAAIWKSPEKPSARVFRSLNNNELSNDSNLADQIAVNRSATPKKLNLELKGDLDSILLTALREEPAERFKSAEMLKDDIQNYLNHLPVSARKSSTRYRIKKFVSRHKAVVAALGAAILLTIVFVVVISYQLKITTEERDRTEQALQRAEHERETAEEVSSFLENLFSAANPMAVRTERLDTLRVGQLLERGEERLYSEFKDRPEIRARMLVVMGRTYRSLGDRQKSIKLLEDAVEFYRNQSHIYNDDAALAYTTLGATYIDVGKNPEGEKLFRSAYNINRSLYSDDHIRIISSLNNIGSALQNQGNFEEAKNYYTDALSMMRRLPEADSTLYANMLNTNSVIAYRLNDFETAIELTRESLSINQILLGNDHPRIGRELNNLAFLLDRNGQTEESIPIYREMLAINMTHLNEDHPILIASVGNLADALSRTGQHEEAESHFQRAFALYRLRPENQSPELSVMLGNYASMLTRINNLTAAESIYREALQADLAIFGETHSRVGILKGRIGGILCQTGRYADGIQLIDEAIAVLQSHFPRDHPRLMDVQNASQNCSDND